MTKLKCLVVDDEPIARYGLMKYLSDNDLVDVIGQAGNIENANEILNSNSVDLLLMDINLMGNNGLEFVQKLESIKPMVIFITAYSEYAVESYNLNAIDYLLKPVEKDRFNQAILKAWDKFRAGFNQDTDNSIFVRDGNRYVRLNVDEIEYISGMQNYLQLHLTGSRKLTLHMTMKKAFDQLCNLNFKYVHKSFIVNLNYIESFCNNRIKIRDAGFVPVGRNYKPQISRLLKSKVFQMHD